MARAVVGTTLICGSIFGRRQQVNVDADLFPVRQHERSGRERSQIGRIQFLEGLSPAAWQPLERAVVEGAQRFGHGSIRFGYREELPMAQGQDPALDNLNANLDLSLVLQLLGVAGRITVPT
jgi:hypothetical protein